MGEVYDAAHPIFEPCCLATTIGSLPHTDVALGTRLMFENTSEIPAWVQFPRRVFHENMMVQFTEGMPGLVEDGERVDFDTGAPDFINQLTDFYARYLAVTENGDSDAIDSFGLSAQYAAGFEEFAARLPEQTTPQVMLKGQVTGPFTLGTNLLEEENTDWSLLMETDLDILDFDAYDHMQAITLYPTELHVFLERVGGLGWGIVPTLDKEAAATETVPSLLGRFDKGVERLVSKGLDRELLLRRALMTPSCGAGGVLTKPLAERVLHLLRQLSTTLRNQHGFNRQR